MACTTLSRAGSVADANPVCRRFGRCTLYPPRDDKIQLQHAIPIAVDVFRFGMEECVSVMQIRL